jgi:hypothetical protein
MKDRQNERQTGNERWARLHTNRHKVRQAGLRQTNTDRQRDRLEEGGQTEQRQNKKKEFLKSFKSKNFNIEVELNFD